MTPQEVVAAIRELSFDLPPSVSLYIDVMPTHVHMYRGRSLFAITYYCGAEPSSIIERFRTLIESRLSDLRRRTSTEQAQVVVGVYEVLPSSTNYSVRGAVIVI